MVFSLTEWSDFRRVPSMSRNTALYMRDVIRAGMGFDQKYPIPALDLIMGLRPASLWLA